MLAYSSHHKGNKGKNKMQKNIKYKNVVICSGLESKKIYGFLFIIKSFDGKVLAKTNKAKVAITMANSHYGK